MKPVCLLLFLALVHICAGSLAPSRIILTFANELTAMQVTFTTSTLPTKSSVTFWATSDPSHPTVIVAAATDIHTFDHKPTGIDYMTTLTMTPLVRGTAYSYYVSGHVNDSSTDSAKHSFKTIPSDSDTLRIGIYGDLGAYGAGLIETGKGGLNYYAQNQMFDFIIHNGDLAYNLGSGNGHKGVEFLQNVESITSIMPYIVTPGNHEFLDDSESFYRNWFLGQTILGKTSGSPNPLMFYSFDVGSKLHIVVISTEVYCEDHDYVRDQYTWLENDLATVQKREVKPWIVTLGHRQIYLGESMSFHGKLMRLGLQCNDSTLKYCAFQACDSGKNCGFSIERLFDRYSVSMYYSGHIHAYNRMFPIGGELMFEAQDRDLYLNPQHPVYVVSGAAGTENAPPKEHISLASPTAKAHPGHSFTLLTLFNDTHLRQEQINITDASIVDTFWIERDSKKKPWDKKSELTLKYDGETQCDQ